MPIKFVPVLIVLAALSLTKGCDRMPMRGGAIEAAPIVRADVPTVPGEICRAWGMSLPTRSRADTPQTADEIEEGYDAFAAACPEFEHLIP